MEKLEAVKCQNMDCWCRKSCHLIEDNEEECVHYVSPKAENDTKKEKEILEAIHFLEAEGYTINKTRIE